jgi:SAM-dependent methyltransferase
MIPFQLHRRIPLVRRPFFQRDQAMQERDRLIAERDALAAERDRLNAKMAGSVYERDQSTAHPSVKTAPSDRRAALCGLIDVRGGKGLEFGPLSRPIVRPDEGDIRYVDYARTEALRQKYARSPDHNPSEIVDISYVWSDGSLREAIRDGTTFDYAVASHVIEHVPDVIGWLGEILSVLRVGGLISLAIPDSRYTLDRFRPTTTPAMLIDHWLRQARGHSPQQVFDYFSRIVNVGINEIIALHEGQDPVTERYHSDEFAMDRAREAVASDTYVDCHASVFTPRSFLATMRTLISLGLVEAELVDFYDTRFHGIEFMCFLQKSGSRDVSLISDIIRRLPSP